MAECFKYIIIIIIIIIINVILCVTVSIVYFIIFASLQFAGVQMEIYYKADLYLHPTLISILLMAAQVVLYKVYRNYFLHNPASHAVLDKTRAGKAREGDGRQQHNITLLFALLFLHYIHVSFLGIWRYLFYLMIFFMYQIPLRNEEMPRV